MLTRVSVRNQKIKDSTLIICGVSKRIDQQDTIRS